MSDCSIDVTVSERTPNNGIPRRFSSGTSEDPVEPPPVSLLGPIVQGAVDSLLDGQRLLSTTLTAMQDELDALRRQQEKSDQHDAVVTDMHERLARLNENFHQRETLGPVFQCLISIADRSREKMKRLRKQVARGSDTKPLGDHLRDLIDTRNIDVIEVEQALNVLGVASFRERGRTLNPQRQKELGRVKTTRVIPKHTIAESIHPGYERDGRVIRHELVHVFTPDSSLTKGES